MLKDMIKDVLLSLSQQQLEWLGRTMAVSAGSLFSPSWYLLRSTLSQYVDVNQLLAAGVSPQMLMSFSMQLRAHGSDEILFALMPSLAGCLVVSLAFIFACSRVGQLAARALVARYATVGLL